MTKELLAVLLNVLYLTKGRKVKPEDIDDATYKENFPELDELIKKYPDFPSGIKEKGVVKDAYKLFDKIILASPEIKHLKESKMNEAISDQDKKDILMQLGYVPTRNNIDKLTDEIIKAFNDDIPQEDDKEYATAIENFIKKYKTDELFEVKIGKNIKRKKKMNEDCHLPTFESFITEAMTLDQAKEKAKKISKEEGVVQHVNQTTRGYKVSDWYDDETTVASFENGKAINEAEMESLKESLTDDIKKAFPKLTDDDFDDHESDLYVKWSQELDDWLKKNYQFYKNIQTFTSQTDKQKWFDIPFAHEDKGIPRKDGSGKGTRANKNRGGCNEVSYDEISQKIGKKM